MRIPTCGLLLACLLACSGCGGTKSTDELIDALHSGQTVDRVKAVRLLPRHKRDAARVVPALIASLKDTDDEVRWGAAIGLGYYGSQAREAISALQAAQHDRDPRVREAATTALSRIDPVQFPMPARAHARQRK